MALYDLTFYDVIRRNAVTHENRPAWFEADDGRELTMAPEFFEIEKKISSDRGELEHILAGSLSVLVYK